MADDDDDITVAIKSLQSTIVEIDVKIGRLFSELVALEEDVVARTRKADIANARSIVIKKVLLDMCLMDYETDEFNRLCKDVKDCWMNFTVKQMQATHQE